MVELYTSSFEYVRQQIFLHSPHAAVQLNKIKDECGDRAAYYAAFVLLCIHARVEQQGMKAFRYLADSDIKGFTFFEYAKQDPYALALFAEVFNTYRAEQEARFGAQNALHD